MLAVVTACNQNTGVEAEGSNPVASEGLSIKYPCSDGMVLQQQTAALVWGHATAGAKVSVTPSWDGKSYSADTDSEGVWRVYVDTPAASYNTYEIKVKGDSDELTISNVLVGEVWIASGQSNMEMPIKGFGSCPVEGANDVISAAPMPDKLRMFTVAIYQPEEPVYDVHETRGWEGAGPETVSEWSATAYFFARKVNEVLDVPVGIVALPRGGASVESWLPKETLAAWGDDLSPEYIEENFEEWTLPYKMYNGMEQPVKGYTARGFIWYQGCTNVGKDEQFEPRMQELVRQWREDWGDTDNHMPFYQCEIAPFDYGGVQDNKGALLRQAQHNAAHSIPNSGIIVTNDLVYDYEANNVHPCQKEPVGKRLAWMALNKTYGFSKIACESPELIKATAVDGGVLLEFSNLSYGLNRTVGVEGLEVCGSNGVFRPVETIMFMNDPQGIFIPGLALKEVRYGWGDFKPGNLKNCEGLPLSPFDIKL